MAPRCVSRKPKRALVLRGGRVHLQPYDVELGVAYDLGYAKLAHIPVVVVVPYVVGPWHVMC